MRSLLSIGILMLHATIFIVAADDGSIVFRSEDESYRPVVSVKSSQNAALALSGQRAFQAAADSTDAFSRQLFKEVAKLNSGNLICSPISTSLIMSMLSYGATGETNRQMRDILKLSKNDVLAKLGLRLLVDKLADYKALELKVANKIFLNYGITPKSDFMQIVQNVFLSEVESIDMSDAASASSVINSWCEDQTNNHIKNILSADDLLTPPLALLLNAVYFKGSWSQPFDPRFTTQKSFWVNGNEEKQVESMFVAGDFLYGRLRDLGASYVELPYKSEDDKHNVSMFIVLPFRRDGLADLEEKFDTVNVADLIRRGEVMTVHVDLPKFRIESKIELIEPLKNMGMKSIFQQPDLSGIVDRPRLFIGKIMQKAFIEIDELGTEAAAVTQSAISSRSMSQPFIANHPFMVVIATTSGTPVTLFTARYTGSQ